MRSPQKTKLKFTSLDYSIYSGVWLHLYKRTIKSHPQYRWSTSQMRVLCAINSLRDLYRGVNTSMGYTPTQVQRLTSLTHERCTWALAKLAKDELLTEQLECGPKRTIRRYKLTKKGQTIVDQMVDMDVVHERIIDILYGRRLLKH